MSGAGESVAWAITGRLRFSAASVYNPARMGQTIKTLVIAFGSAVAMAVAIELVRHYEQRITDGTDELLVVGGRLWAQAVDQARLEAEVRRSMPWVLWFAWEAQQDAIASEEP